MAIIQNREQIFKNTFRDVSGVVSVLETDYTLKVDTTSSACDITLLEIPVNFDRGYKLYVLDNVGNASTYNITVIAPPGHLINGEAQIVINKNYGSLIIRYVEEGHYSAFGVLDASTSTSVSADNGLSTNTSTNVQLGGTLLKETTITNGIYSLLFTKDSASTPGNPDSAININLTGSERLYGVEVQNQTTNISSAAFYSVSTNGKAGQFRGFGSTAAVLITNERADPGGGLALNVNSTLGTGIDVTTSQSYSIRSSINASDAGNSSIPVIESSLRTSQLDGIRKNLDIVRYVTVGSMPLVGIGSAITFFNESEGVPNAISRNTGEIINSMSNVGETTYSSEWLMTLKNNGALNNVLQIYSTGQMRLHNYGSGTITGTATYALGVDASGNIIEIAL